MKLRKGAHLTYSIYYHIVFIPKYRREIFEEKGIDGRVKEAIQRMAPFHDWEIEEMETDEDHIHIFISAPPRFSPAKIVRLIKTWTYRHVYRQTPEIKSYLWGGKMWCEGYFVSTVNDTTTKDQIRKYVKEQKEKMRQLGLFEIPPAPSVG